jgi:hypothetical protein
LITPDLNLLVVEGGPKGITAYKKLMQRRIDWSQYQDPTIEPNVCTLVWEVHDILYREMFNKGIFVIFELWLKVQKMLYLTWRNFTASIIGRVPRIMFWTLTKYNKPITYIGKY